MRKRFPWLLYAIAAVLIVLLACVPLIGAFTASAFADANGCVLNEGGSTPCVVGGHNYGDLLEFLFVSGWFMFITFPAGAVALIAWTLVLLVHLALRMAARRRNRTIAG